MVIVVERDLLRAMIKDKKITIGEMQSFFQLDTKEELLDLLIQFLDSELLEIRFSKPKQIPPVERVCQKIDTLYEYLRSKGVSDLPYESYYNELTQEVQTVVNHSQYRKGDSENMTVNEQLMLIIHYYRDMKNLKCILTEDIINTIDDPLLIEGIINKYLQTLKTNAYDYYKSVIELLLEKGKHNQNILIQICSYLIAGIDTLRRDEINSERFREIGGLLSKSKSALMNVNNLYEINIIPPPREDTYIFTIDSTKTNIREDAISIRKEFDETLVTIYITDSTRILKNSKLYGQAMNNWFYKDVNRLLDGKHDAQLFSLNEGTTHDVVACEFHFDERQTITKLNIYEDKIRIDKNYTFGTINKIIRENDARSTPIKYLQELNAISNHLYQNNEYKKRYHFFKEIHYYFNNKKKYKEVQEKTGEFIISQFAILVGSSIAKIFKEQQIPCIYRNNSCNISEEELQELTKICSSQMDDDMSVYEEIKNLKIQSWYSRKNEGHYGLHLDCYVHVTTPVKNFFALVNLKILKDAVIHKQKKCRKRYDTLIDEYMMLQDQKLNHRSKVREKQKGKNIVRKRGNDYE